MLFLRVDHDYFAVRECQWGKDVTHFFFSVKSFGL